MPDRGRFAGPSGRWFELGLQHLLQFDRRETQRWEESRSGSSRGTGDLPHHRSEELSLRIGAGATGPG